MTVVSCVEFGKRKNKELRRETVSIHIIVIVTIPVLMHNCFGFVYFFSFLFFCFLPSSMFYLSCVLSN